MPKYSLVVPTLDRAHLLEGTLDSLSKLNHDSYEIIISNNYSSDNTEAVAKRWTETDPRFRYVQTSKRLAMADHWDFDLRFITGDYFLYVGDDDSFDRNILKALDQYIAGDGVEGVYWRQALYYHKSWFEENRAENLYIRPFTGRKWVIQSKDAIQQMFDLDLPKTFPIGTSFCFKTSIVRSILEECGIFFVRPFPDYTSAMMYLPSISKYLYVDLAMSVIGKSADSNAAATMNGPKERVKQVFVELDGRLYPHMPLNCNVIFNGIAECVKAVQSLRSKELGGYKLNWVQYFRRIHDSLRLEKEFLESEGKTSDFWKALLKIPPKEQLQVITYVLKVEASMLRRYMKHSLLDRRQKQMADDIHNGHFCKKIPSLTQCSQELSEHNLKLGYF